MVSDTGLVRRLVCKAKGKAVVTHREKMAVTLNYHFSPATTQKLLCPLLLLFFSIFFFEGGGYSAFTQPFNKPAPCEPQVVDMNHELVVMNQSKMPPYCFYFGQAAK